MTQPSSSQSTFPSIPLKDLSDRKRKRPVEAITAAPEAKLPKLSANSTAIAGAARYAPLPSSLREVDSSGRVVKLRSSSMGDVFPTKLSSIELEALAKPVFANKAIAAWHHVQTRFAYGDSHQYSVERRGVATWSDLGALVKKAIEATGSKSECLSFTLQDYLWLDDSEPPSAWVSEIQSALKQADAAKSVDVIVRGDPLDPLKLLTISVDGVETSSVEGNTSMDESDTDESIQSVESGPSVVASNDDPVLQLMAEQKPHLLKLYNALSQALETEKSECLGNGASHHLAHGQSSETIELDKVLSQAIPLFNASLDNSEQGYHVDGGAGRTKIVNLTQQLARCAQDLALDAEQVVTPFDSLIAQTHRADVGVYSVGGGQTLTLLLLAIRAMDVGALPLSTRLEGDNRSSRDADGHPINAAVAEIVEQNQRRSHLGKELTISQEGQCLIHMRPDQQRLERMQAYPPQWLFLNVPTNALNQVFSPALMDVMDVLASQEKAPVMVLSSKSFSETDSRVDVPVTSIFSRLYEASPGLERQLLVLGGYYAAPMLVAGEPVHFAVAGKNKEAVESLGRLMTAADRGGSVKHDALSGKSDQIFGTAIMGALKNQAVYTFARQIVRKALHRLEKYPERTSSMQCDQLNEWIDPVIKKVIKTAEQSVEQLTDRSSVAAQVSSESGDKALGFKSITDFQCAPGVRADFERCMVRPISESFIDFVASLKIILELPALEQGPALTDLLAERVVDSGRGFGSRNSRDGVIDEALRIVFEDQTKKGICQSNTFAEFRTQWTPTTWLAKTTEGRNGMYPVLNHLVASGREIPTLVLEAAKYYGEVDGRVLSLLQRADAHRHDQAA